MAVHLHSTSTKVHPPIISSSSSWAEEHADKPLFRAHLTCATNALSNSSAVPPSGPNTYPSILPRVISRLTPSRMFLLTGPRYSFPVAMEPSTKATAKVQSSTKIDSSISEGQSTLVPTWAGSTASTTWRVQEKWSWLAWEKEALQSTAGPTTLRI